MENSERITTFDPPTVDPNAHDTARENVFGTDELFEGILLFLPVKTIYCDQVVSKRWASVIANSVSLQQMMFLRLRDQPELWIVDTRHMVGANCYGKKFAHLNDTEMKIRRVKVLQDGKRSITPVTLNPMLQNDNPYMSNILRMVTGATFERVLLHESRMDVFRDSDASFWNTYLTDPPCHKVEIRSLALRLEVPNPPAQSTKLHYINASVLFTESQRSTIESNAALRMGDVLQACLTKRGSARSSFSGIWGWRNDDATIGEAVEVIKERLGSESISKSPRMSVRLRLIGVGSAAPLLATDEERAAANVDWKSSQ